MCLNNSEQKDKIEVNHEYNKINYYKKISFNNYNKNDINLMMNNINSVKSDSLSECSLYELILNFIPQKLKDLFDIEEIEQKII